MLWNLRESAVSLACGSMDYAVFGCGSQPFVIIPGLSLRDVRGAGAGLALMYRMFAKEYRVYVFDKPSDIAEGCTTADLAEATAAAMEALFPSPPMIKSEGTSGISGSRLPSTNA